MVLPEEIAAYILAMTVRRRTSLRSVAEEFFERNPELDYMKPIVRVLTLGVARNFMLLDHALEKLGYGPPSHARSWMLARVLAYEAIFGKLKRSRVEKLASKARLKPEDVYKLKGVKPSDIVSDLHGIDKLAVRYSFPRWILEELLTAGVYDLDALLEALNRDPVRYIRVAPGVDRVKLAKMLREEGVIVEPDPRLPDLMRIVEGADRAAKTKAYEEGLYTIQDKASALVTHLLEPQGEVAVDYTAGAAVKASHAAWLGARFVVACDIKPLRFTGRYGARGLISRLKVGHVIDLVVADARRPATRPLKRIIVDPPCSDIGRLQYEPEIKMWLTRGDAKMYSRIQRQILKAVVEHAAPGARIVYSVCTLTYSEAERVVKRVLRESSGVNLVRIKPPFGDESPKLPGAIRTYPHRHDSQGFFIAVLEKEG
ncbi:Fmu (Sun) domain protein [Pyrolobus fumarii 1A]|uniref:Fmu (Sun) domain protein n=1 Tax=Pyrolobus fumarii (strain DSM 11204 / 1A) TaxID=694429 RepID=G0EDJ0_PYRF1|nr:RsmB/NOP family class I SAM-dependent RNA methyltransferase [Pyrolobus fumarii]AEM38675.1 Fmu (Sun) domain protein [Pyrolobus fumarii 1A]